VHITPKVPRSGPVNTLCGKTLAAGSYEASDAAADCVNCIRRSRDPSRISSAFFEQDAGTELLRLSLEQARFRKPAPKVGGVPATAKPGAKPKPVRDLIREPMRPRLVRSEPEPDRCAFCAIAKAQVRAATVYSGPLVIAFMDQQQSRKGHVLVVPIRHVDDIFELNPPTGAELMAAVVTISNAVRTAFKPDGVTIWSSNGAAAGQTVQHLHFHVLPRWKNDGLPRVFINAAKKPPTEELEAQAQAIRSLL